MVLIFHIASALVSIALGAILLFAPSRVKLRLTYGLTAVTLGSGFYLVATSPSPILGTCLIGMLYLGVVSLGIVSARSHLYARESTTRQRSHSS